MNVYCFEKFNDSLEEPNSEWVLKQISELEKICEKINFFQILHNREYDKSGNLVFFESEYLYTNGLLVKHHYYEEEISTELYVNSKKPAQLKMLGLFIEHYGAPLLEGSSPKILEPTIHIHEF